MIWVEIIRREFTGKIIEEANLMNLSWVAELPTVDSTTYM